MLGNKGKSVKKGLKQIGWTFGLFTEYRIRIIIYTALILIKTIIDLRLTYAVGNIVQYIVEDDMHGLIVFMRFFIFVFVLTVVVTFVSNRVNVHNYTSMHKSLMLRLYDKTINADWERLEEYHSGDLLTRISQDVATVSGNINGLIPTIISDMCSVLAAVGVVIFFDYSIMIVFVLILPLVFLSTKLFAGKVLDYQRIGRDAEADIMLLNKETFHNMQSVKAFDLFEIFHEKMDIRAERLRRCDLKSNLVYMMSWVSTSVLGFVAIVLSGAWMIYRVHTGYITVGNIASMAALSASAAAAMSNLFALMPKIVECITASERIREIFELPNEDKSERFEEAKAIISTHKDMKMNVLVKNMSFHYRTGSNIFENADISAKSGEIVALVGPSGEGKTTMLRILLGIVTAQSGTVKINWEDGTQVDMGPNTRAIISYVPQGNTMMAGTIAENMRMIKPNASDEDIINALKTACAYDFVKKLPDGINHYIGEGGHGFSEGQNQRLAIARAVIHNTPILFLDEATSALDVVTERQVLRNLMNGDSQRICILTTHRPSVLSMCHRVYRIADKHTKVIDEVEIQKLMNEF